MILKFTGFVFIIFLNTEISFSSFKTIPSISRAFQSLSEVEKGIILDAYRHQQENLDSPFSSNMGLNNLYSSIVTLNRTSPKDLKRFFDNYLSLQSASHRTDIQPPSPSCPTTHAISSSLRPSVSEPNPPKNEEAKLFETYRQIINSKKEQGHPIVLVLGAFPFERDHFNFESLVNLSGKSPFVIYLDSRETLARHINEGTEIRPTENELLITGDFNNLMFLETIKEFLKGKVDLITADVSVSKFLDLHAYSLSILLDLLDQNGELILDWVGQTSTVLETTEQKAFDKVKEFYSNSNPREYVLKKRLYFVNKTDKGWKINDSTPENMRLKAYATEIYPQYFYDWINLHLGEYYTDRFIFSLQNDPISPYWSVNRGYRTDNLFIHIRKK